MALQNAPREKLEPILALYNQGNYEGAVTTAKSLAVQFPQTPFLHNVIANSLIHLGKNAEAIGALQNLLKLQPKNADAWNNLGMMHLQLEQLPNAGQSFENALKVDSNHTQAIVNISTVLERLGKLDQAAGFYQKLIDQNPKNFGAINAMGGYHAKQKDHETALKFFQKASKIKPDFAPALCNIGVMLGELGRQEEAVNYFKKSLKIDPNNVDTLSNFSAALVHLQKFDEVEPYFQKTFSIDPMNHVAHHAMGIMKVFEEDFQGCAQHMEIAIKSNPMADDSRFAFINALRHLDQEEQAFRFAKESVAYLPDSSKLHSMMGNIHKTRKEFDESNFHYERAIELDPTDEVTIGRVLRGYYELCDWQKSAKHLPKLDTLGLGDVCIDPYSIFSLDDDPKKQIEQLKKTAEQHYKAIQRHKFSPSGQHPEKLHIGVFSADYNEHPVGKLIMRLFRLIDRDKYQLSLFETTTINHDEINAEFREIADAYYEFENVPRSKAIDNIRSKNLDIALDLSGHTKGGNLKWFAEGMAPVQIAFLGYPGSVGADFIDYIICDDTIIPEENYTYFTEKPLILPHTYMPTDDKRPISDHMTRAGQNLPDDAFVFASFNNSYKITPEEFDIWMRLLSQIEGSVLWLAKSPQQAMDNLRKEAEARGISADRLVFAKREDLIEDHMGRLGLADLFLDCFNYNAHSTTVDALWAGLPVLTRQGRSFAARVAAGLLRAVDMPELITFTSEEYETTALRLAQNPDELNALRAKLAKNRETEPLFNTELFTRNFEKALEMAYQRFLDGKKPDTIRVPE